MKPSQLLAERLIIKDQQEKSKSLACIANVYMADTKGKIKVRVWAAGDSSRMIWGKIARKSMVNKGDNLLHRRKLIYFPVVFCLKNEIPSHFHNLGPCYSL